jgi:hypothetical protein
MLQSSRQRWRLLKIMDGQQNLRRHRNSRADCPGSSRNVSISRSHHWQLASRAWLSQ